MTEHYVFRDPDGVVHLASYYIAVRSLDTHQALHFRVSIKCNSIALTVPQLGTVGIAEDIPSIGFSCVPVSCLACLALEAA